MDTKKNRWTGFAGLFLMALLLPACSSTSTNQSEVAAGGQAGATGTGGSDAGTGGLAGASGSAGTTSSGGDSGSGGATGGTGGGTVTGGTGGTVTGGTGGSSTGGTGGTGGSSTGGGGSTGGTGGGATGGTGGTGGGPCVEPDVNTIIQLCQGNCGTVAHKCDAGTYNCLSYVPANACTGVHQWCQPGAEGSGTCGGCVRRPNYDGICGGMVQARPFNWICPGVSHNNIQDDGETDIDCGGPHNPDKCGTGQSCAGNSDCELQACSAGKCANSTKLPTGCAYKFNTLPTGEVEYCCPDSENGCSRAPGADFSVTTAYCTSGKPYAMQCPAGKTLASAGCTSSNGLWCCASTMP